MKNNNEITNRTEDISALTYEVNPTQRDGFLSWKRQDSFRVAFALLAACLLVGCDSDAVESQAQPALTANWQTGQERHYILEDHFQTRSESKSESKPGSPPQVTGLEQSLILDTRWTVREVSAAGDVEFGVIIDRVQFTANGAAAPGSGMVRNLRVDTKVPPLPRANGWKGVETMFKALSAFVGSENTVKLDSQGNVTAFTLSESLAESLKSNTARELERFFGDLFTPAGIRYRITNWCTAVPVEAPAEGEKWTQKSPSRLGDKIVSTRSHTFVGPKVENGNTFLQIDFTSIPEFQVNEKSNNRPTVSGKGSGGAMLNAETHQIESFRQEEHMVLNAGKFFPVATLTTIYSARLGGPSVPGAKGSESTKDVSQSTKPREDSRATLAAKAKVQDQIDTLESQLQAAIDNRNRLAAQTAVTQQEIKKLAASDAKVKIEAHLATLKPQLDNAEQEAKKLTAQLAERKQYMEGLAGYKPSQDSRKTLDSTRRSSDAGLDWGDAKGGLKDKPLVNSLGMKFVPVPIAGDRARGGASCSVSGKRESGITRLLSRRTRVTSGQNRNFLRVTITRW